MRFTKTKGIFKTAFEGGGKDSFQKPTDVVSRPFLSGGILEQFGSD